MKYEYLISYLYKRKNKELSAGFQTRITKSKINSCERVAEITKEIQETNKDDMRKGTYVVIINIQLLRSVKEDGDKK